MIAVLGSSAALSAVPEPKTAIMDGVKGGSDVVRRQHRVNRISPDSTSSVFTMGELGVAPLRPYNRVPHPVDMIAHGSVGSVSFVVNLMRLLRARKTHMGSATGSNRSVNVEYPQCGCDTGAPPVTTGLCRFATLAGTCCYER
jgi:hypothetical protein